MAMQRRRELGQMPGSTHQEVVVQLVAQGAIIDMECGSEERRGEERVLLTEYSCS